MSDQSTTKQAIEIGFTMRDLEAAMRQVLGTDEGIDFDMIDAPRIDGNDFDRVRKLVAYVHKAEHEQEFTNVASAEVVSILLAAECLQAYGNRCSEEERQAIWNTILAKAIMHAKSLFDAVDSGKLKGERTSHQRGVSTLQ